MRILKRRSDAIYLTERGAFIARRISQANAMLLPTVMGFNRMVCRERFSQIGRALTNKKSDDRDAIAAVSELIAEVGQSKRLADAGAKPEHYSAWAQAALEDICLRSNPRTATQAQIIDLYAAAG